MERTVPYTASEEVELYTRTYYSLLRSTSPVQIKTLEEVHSAMNSLLHSGARGEEPDMSAFIYGLLRLPEVIEKTRLVVLGQSADVFITSGIGNVENWENVRAAARRRRCYFNGEDTLACIIASRSDIDDVIPMLTAYQIERNKIHFLLRDIPPTVFSTGTPDTAIAKYMRIPLDDLERLKAIWGPVFYQKLHKIQEKPIQLSIQLLSGSVSDYNRATNAWWGNIESNFPSIRLRPVYFISSNTHSVANLVSGFAQSIRDELIQFLNESKEDGLIQEWKQIQSRDSESQIDNFLYYALKKYRESMDKKEFRKLRRKHETQCGIYRIDSKHYFDVDTQVIDLSEIKLEGIDPRLAHCDCSFLEKSDALILNIDYPLGLAAYNILAEIASRVSEVLGVYIMGKAATLNGVLGDVMIPNVVHDEHSRNTYLFDNAFSAADLAPHLEYSTVMDNQKSVTVPGTFLQTAHFMDVFYREGYTGIEMEAGAYLSAVYEMFRPKRHPVDEIVNLYPVQFDLGIIHYASDKPMSKGRNLGAGTLSFMGMEPTYASSIAILNRIFDLERSRIEKKKI